MMVESSQFLKNILHQRLPRTKIRSLHLTVEEIEINTQNVKSVSVLMEFKCIFNDIVNAPRPHGPLLVELNPHQNVTYLIYVICYILISLKHHGIIIHFIILWKQCYSYNALTTLTTFTCSKSTIETQEQCVKSVQS